MPATDVVVANLFRDGQPLGVSPRLALQRAIDGWTAIGYMVDVGIELEAFVLSETAMTGCDVVLRGMHHEPGLRQGQQSVVGHRRHRVR